METASTQRRGVICPVLIVEGGSISGIVVQGSNPGSLTSWGLKWTCSKKNSAACRNPSPHEAATAPPRRRGGKRRLDELSAQARGARGEAVQAGERRRSGHRAASPQAATSTVSSLNTD